MKQLILISIFPLVSIIGFSQNFPLTLAKPNTANLGKVYALPNGDILINNGRYDYSTNETYTNIITINANGEILSNKRFEYTINNILVYSSDTIYFLYRSYKADSLDHLYIERVNENFERKNIDSILIYDHRSIRLKLFKHNNSILFFASHHTNPHIQSNLTLGLINKEGKFSSNKKTIQTRTPYILDAIMNQQKEWYIFCALNYIIKLDSSYNLLDELNFSWDGNDFDTDYHSVWLSDKYFITGGTNILNQLKIVKSYSNFATRKRITFDENNTNDRAGQFTNLARTDSFVYFVGYKEIDSTDINYTGNGETYIFVACLDFDLNLLWERKSGGDAFYRVSSVCATTNNECVVAATRDTIIDNKNINETYILKLDKNGNIITAATIKNAKRQFLSYPNPGANFMQLEIPDITAPAILKVYNANGALQHQQNINDTHTQINTQTWPCGIYLYCVEQNGNMLGQGKWVKR